MNNFYVYALLDPRKDHQPFYIGKGKGNRCMNHFAKKELDHGKNPIKQNTIKAIIAAGLQVKIVFMVGDLLEDDAFALETALIKQYGRINFDENGILTNILVDPGCNRTGMLHTLESKAKMKEAAVGRTLSKEHKDKIGKASTGRVTSKETRKKQSEAAAGRVMSEEQKEIRRLAQTGKKRAPYKLKETAEVRSERAKLNGSKGGRPRKVT